MRIVRRFSTTVNTGYLLLILLFWTRIGTSILVFWILFVSSKNWNKFFKKGRESLLRFLIHEVFFFRRKREFDPELVASFGLFIRMFSFRLVMHINSNSTKITFILWTINKDIRIIFCYDTTSLSFFFNFLARRLVSTSSRLTSFCDDKKKKKKKA